MSIGTINLPPSFLLWVLIFSLGILCVDPILWVAGILLFGTLKFIFDMIQKHTYALGYFMSIV